MNVWHSFNLGKKSSFSSFLYRCVTVDPSEMTNIQKPGEIAEKAASDSLSSEQNGYVESAHLTGLCRFSVKSLTVS